MLKEVLVLIVAGKSVLMLKSIISIVECVGEGVDFLKLVVMEGVLTLCMIEKIVVVARTSAKGEAFATMACVAMLRHKSIYEEYWDQLYTK